MKTCHQEKLSKIWEIYATNHNISFSTDPNPIKSKTKGLIFTPDEKNIETENIKLNGNPLPWVKQAKYLGNTIENVINGLAHDIKLKRARYIEKNCELNQEFMFAHPEIKSKLNHIYNRFNSLGLDIQKYPNVIQLMVSISSSYVECSIAYSQIFNRTISWQTCQSYDLCKIY